VKTGRGAGTALLRLLAHMYGPAERCKRFSDPEDAGLAAMYPASHWSGMSLRAIMDISARAISLAARPRRWAMCATRVSTCREDRSSISFHPLADLGEAAEAVDAVVRVQDIDLHRRDGLR
jgi:hypothetical protein